MQDYASRQRRPQRHAVGIGLVVLLHLLLLWAIQSGMSQEVKRKMQVVADVLLLASDAPKPPPPPPPKSAPPPRNPPPVAVPAIETPVVLPPSANAVTVAPSPPTPAAPAAPAAPAPAPAQPAKPAVPKLTTPAQFEKAIALANAAIRDGGADPAAVRQRLLEMGVPLAPEPAPQ